MAQVTPRLPNLLVTAPPTGHFVQALELAVACLSFDFVGTSVEDWAEDVATLQIPGAWRSLLEDLTTLQLFTDYYFASTPPLSPIALECLVRCASVRRSLFGSEETRVAFLAALMNVTLRVLQSQQGLEHQENYHEFCRCASYGHARLVCTSHAVRVSWHVLWGRRCGMALCRRAESPVVCSAWHAHECFT